jgi:hypothetical protein
MLYTSSSYMDATRLWKMVRVCEEMFCSACMQCTPFVSAIGVHRSAVGVR